MQFHNFDGGKTKEQVLAIIDANINAYECLKNVGIENCIFENGNACCVKVKADFENLKKIVNVFADKGKFNNDLITEFQGWDFKRLFGTDIVTYEDLNNAIFRRIEFLRTALVKTMTETKIVEKPVTKSIDQNTLWTAILGLGGISASFLLNCVNNVVSGILGGAVFVFLLIILCYRRKFFSEL